MFKRDDITHSYHSLDESIVWDIIQYELPKNKIEVRQIVDYLNNTSEKKEIIEE